MATATKSFRMAGQGNQVSSFSIGSMFGEARLQRRGSRLCFPVTECFDPDRPRSSRGLTAEKSFSSVRLIREGPGTLERIFVTVSYQCLLAFT